jgi:hypothetical protein
MKRNPQEKLLHLYADTAREIFTPAEIRQVAVGLGRNFIDIRGPEPLKKRLYDAVMKKMRSGNARAA